jgi:hypothetical protein
VTDDSARLQDRVSQIVMHNTPEPVFRVKQVGPNDTIQFHVDWEKMGRPSPKLFHKVSDVEISLATMRDEYFETDAEREAHARAFDAVSDLLSAMAAARTDDEQTQYDLLMGNLELLPEVSLEPPTEDGDE